MIEVYEVVAVARTEALCLIVLISFFAVLVVWLVNGWLACEVVRWCDENCLSKSETEMCSSSAVCALAFEGTPMAPI